MKNLLLSFKIKKELKRFQEFKKDFKFEMKEVEEKEDGTLICDGMVIREGKDGEWVGETDTFINVGYKFHGPMPKVLSNLFHYEFVFRGFKLNSAEGIFQGFKVKDKKAQRYLFRYYGLDSNNIKAASDFDWKGEGAVYFQGKRIDRFSKEFDDFIDEMYVSLLQNPLYRNSLKNAGDKYILHALGTKEKEKTVFTRYEFEYELNCLKAYVQKYYK